MSNALQSIYAIGDDELIIDCFAGGGGASLGILRATGRSPDIAINHNKFAIAMHRINHAMHGTRHLTCDIWAADPVKEIAGKKVGLLWASPDCRTFSKCRNGPVTSKRSRDLAWVVIKWLALVKPRVVCLENVQEFRDWCDLNPDWTPAAHKKGETFQKFLAEFRRHGYEIEHKVLRACDYGEPTSRERLFIIARRDGGEIRFPDPTHARPDDIRVRSGLLRPWRTAAECIDWSIPAYSIFMSTDEARKVGVKRPLVPNTMRRTAKGVLRHVVNSKSPFIAPIGSVTIGNASDMIIPFIEKYRENSIGSDIRAPMPTVTANSYTKRPGGSAPLALASAIITHAQNGGRSRPIDAPLHTICASTKDQNQIAMIRLSPNDTVETVTAAFMGQQNTGMIGHDMRKPVSTIVSKGSTQTLSTAVMVPAEAAHHISYLYGSNKTANAGNPGQPLKTITSGGNHAALVSALLLKYYSEGDPSQSLTTPLHTITTKGRFGLVTVTLGGAQYVITDITLRMLAPKELFAAQGFGLDYIFEYGLDEHGKRIKLTKTQQIGMCGNSVPPGCAEAIIAAQFPTTAALKEAA